HLYSMVQGLDKTFDALIFIGYHSAGGTDTNPLAHTMSTNIDSITLNGEYVSEFLLHSYIAGQLNVPVVFVSGDSGLCDEVKKINRNITTVPVKKGIGDATINIHPQLALELIKSGVNKSLKEDLNICNIELPQQFELDVRYKDHTTAIRRSVYTNTEQIAPKIVRFKTNDYIEVLRAIEFLL
ncbi:MAG TPA: amino acid amidase, partial [Clostridiales bacterium]|nr:amino acid amidase [Clostridiales bacterium]